MPTCDDCELPAVFMHTYEDWTDYYCDKHSLRSMRRDLYHAEQRQRPLPELITVELVPA